MEVCLKVGLIGAGVFGSYHADKISCAETVENAGIYDPDTARASVLAARYGAPVLTDLDALLRASDAVIIAAPAGTHAALARAALENDCHVLVEKPLALSAPDAHEIAALATERDLILQVGHQERLVCAALGLFEIAAPPKRIEITRAGPPPPSGRTMDVSVIWDLMIHDIDLVNRLFGGEVEITGCEGRRELGDHLDQASATLRLGEHRAKLTASRIAPERRRTMRLVYDEGDVLVDFIARTVDNQTRFKLNTDLASLVPDPLGAADNLFFEACRFGAKPFITGTEAADAVRVAEQLERLALERVGV